MKIKNFLRLFVSSFSVLLLAAISLFTGTLSAQTGGLTYQSGQTITLGGLPALVNVSFTNVAPQLLSTGNQDLYTVPAGRRAIVSAMIYNSTVTTVVSYPLVDIGGTYYRVASN